MNKPTGKGLIGQAGVEPSSTMLRCGGGSDWLSWEVILMLFVIGMLLAR